MQDEGQYWEGYKLNSDGTIQFDAIIDYGVLTVPSGAILQFFTANSQADIDNGNVRMMQLHLGPDHLRECGEQLLRIAAELGC